MKTSLSAFVPVRNGQSFLAPVVRGLLDVLPELTPRFDVVLIDDGSTDATPEVARELTLEFPQIYFVAHPSQWGQAAAMRTGLLHSAGNIVLFRPEDWDWDLLGLSQLWQAVQKHDMAFVRPATKAPLGWLPRLPRGAGAVAPLALQMVHRHALDTWRRETDTDDWMGHILNRGMRWQEVAIRRPGQTATAWPHAAAPRKSPPLLKQPNYLSRIKAFALGE